MTEHLSEAVLVGLDATEFTMPDAGGRQPIDRLTLEDTGGDRHTGDAGSERVCFVVRLTPTRVAVC